jgi:mono/diheme cytochrome c family protein
MMGRLVLNLVLFVALVALLGVNWLAAPSPDRPNFEFLPQMVHTPRYGAFAANPNFADGKTLQTPAPGSIPRGSMPLHYTAAPVDQVRAGEELTTPITPDNAWARQRGATVYANYCTVCHGTAGAGDGPVSMRGFPAPPSLLGPKAVRMKDGQLFHLLTYGQGNMPPYASQISRTDRWNVIAYVRQMQANAAVPPAAAATSAPTAPAAPAEAKGGKP